jgi:hypothetical protein
VPEAWRFLDQPDRELLAPLRAGRMVAAVFNRGGSSISMRVDLAGGGRGSFKPDQTNRISVPRKEVAAYRVSRLLGLTSVAPVLATAYPRDEVLAALGAAPPDKLLRFAAEVPSTPEGLVTGSLAWWIPKIAHCRIGGLRVDEAPGVAVWTRQLTIGQEMPRDPLVAQVSDMLVFDFLINNVDRWPGGNVRCSPDGEQLFFMDNAMAFAPAPFGHVKVRTRLYTVQRFSRRLYQALVALDADDVTDTMMTDTGWWPRLLSRGEVTALMARRNHLVAYIDALIARHGASRVLVFP